MDDQKNQHTNRSKEDPYELHESAQNSLNKDKLGGTPEYTDLPSEAQEFAETIEFSPEKVRETREVKAEEKAAKRDSGKLKKELTRKEYERILIQGKQPRADIQGDLQKYFKSEIKKLEREKKSYEGKATMMFEFAETWKKIREFYEQLSQLAKMTYEALKKLWLKLIHGIAI